MWQKCPFGGKVLWRQGSFLFIYLDQGPLVLHYVREIGNIAALEYFHIPLP